MEYRFEMGDFIQLDFQTRTKALISLDWQGDYWIYKPDLKNSKDEPRTTSS